MSLNERRGSTIRIACSCKGHHPGCVNCRGSGEVIKRACERCGGMGKQGGDCINCKGSGWREIDNWFPDT